MNTGLNVDPRHWTDLDALAAKVAATGATWVRTVLKPPPDSLLPWIVACTTHGLQVLGVLARESFPDWTTDWTAPQYAACLGAYAMLYDGNLDGLQYGNEPDNVGGSSWTMDPATLEIGLRATRLAFPATPLVGPGLIYATTPDYQFDTSLVDAEAVHLYVPPGTIALEPPASGLPLWVTEWPCYPGLAAIVGQQPVAVALGFCWSNNMVRGYGITDTLGRKLQPRYREFCALSEGEGRGRR